MERPTNTETCAKHATEIEGFTNDQLAEALGNLRYDALEDILWLLARKLIMDAVADEARGRQQLASMLTEAGATVEAVSEQMSDIWELCKPHMDV